MPHIQSGTDSVFKGRDRGVEMGQTTPHSPAVSDVPPNMDSEEVNPIHLAKGKSVSDDALIYATNCVVEKNGPKMDDGPGAGANDHKHNGFPSESLALTTKDVNHEPQSTDKGK